MARVKKPCGLMLTDTLDDAIKRADELASPTSHSGSLLHSKDLRRIVLLVYEYRKLWNRNRYDMIEYGKNS